MDNIKAWALLLLFVSIGGFIYYYLLPVSGVSETAKSVLCVFSLSAVCIPLFGSFSDIDKDIFNFEAYSTLNEQEALENFALSTKETLNLQIEECVKKYTDTPYEIDIGINISDSYSINIEYVRLIFEKDFGDIYALSRALENICGFIPEITVKNENGQS